MSITLLVALVIVFAVILSMRRRRGPRVTEIDRTVRRKKEGEGQ